MCLGMAPSRIEPQVPTAATCSLTPFLAFSLVWLALPFFLQHFPDELPALETCLRIVCGRSQAETDRRPTCCFLALHPQILSLASGAGPSHAPTN